MDVSHKTLILASTSPFRRTQMAATGLTFQAASPVCDETPLDNETPKQLALRLAIGKAQSLSTQYQNALIIGCDQTAACEGVLLGKPLTLEKAREMLAWTAGRVVDFFSAIAILNTDTGSINSRIEQIRVTMRPLTTGQIEGYLKAEPDALFCAGAAKSEGRGALLIRRIECQDPSALIGLPVLALTDLLAEHGVDVLAMFAAQN